MIDDFRSLRARAYVKIPSKMNASDRSQPGYKPDPHAKFRIYLGKQRRLTDRRRAWASPTREFVPGEQLSGGEQKARARFWKEINKGSTPMLAAAYALEIHCGPIPELETPEAFADYWSPARLEKIGMRWRDSKHGATSRQRHQGRTAQTLIIEELPHLTEDLLDMARNPDVPWATRKNAINDLMERLPAGVWVDQAPPQPAIKIPDITKENAPELERLLLLIPTQIKDGNVASMLCSQIKFLLAKCLPEKYGDKIDINMNHTVDLRTPLQKGEARAEAFILERVAQRQKLADAARETATSTSGDASDDRGDESKS